jgi:hypothetical protein
VSAVDLQERLESVGPPEPGAPSAPTSRRRRWPLTAQVLSLSACVALWWLSVSRIRVGTLDDYGLLPAFPLSFYAALGLLVASFVAALCAPRRSEAVLAGHVLALIVFLHGTMPLIFSEPFYPWVYKHFGVVEYIDLHGRLDASVDIYQNWPAFFTLSAWFGRVAGTRPLEYAAWAQVFFNACNLVLLRYVFGSLSRDIRLVWIAIFVFFAANWVAQDYFSPQAFAFTLSLGLCGVILRWLLIAPDRAWMARWLNRAAAFVARLGRRRRSGAPEDEPAGSQRVGRRTARNVAIVLFALIVTTHQLTPYMLIAGLAVLTFLGVVRPRLLVVLFAAMALGYLLPRLGFIERYYGLLGSAGEPLKNVRSAAVGFNGLAGEPGRVLCAHAARVLSLVVWGLGLIGAVRRLRAGYKNLGIAALAVAPAFIALADTYGGEAIYRVFLFSLPWFALLTAFALRPGGDDWSTVRTLPRLLLPLTLLLALFLPAYFGMAATNEVRSGEVAASQYFYDHAPPHSVLMIASPQFPVRLAGNYEQFRLTIGEADPSLLTVKPSLRHKLLGDRQVPVIAQAMRDYAGGEPVFLVVSRNGKVTSQVLDLLPRGSLDELGRALSRSRRFRVWYRNADTTIFQLVQARPAGDPSNGATSR